MGDPMNVPAAPGNMNNVNVPIRVFNDVKVVALEWNSDHHVIKDNAAGWSNSGSLYPKPEFRLGGTCAPVSHTKNQYLSGTVTFKVSPEDAPERECTVRCKAVWGEQTWKAKLKGGTSTTSFAVLLPDVVQVMKGEIAFWVDNGADGEMSAGTIPDHTIYVTMDTPVSLVGTDEEGIADRRMRAAVELACAASSDDGFRIAEHVMSTVKEYTLVPDPSLAHFNHPQYHTANGGAWPIAEFAAKKAECQAICRFTRAVLAQIGCPGVYDVCVVWAEPTTADGKTGKEGALFDGGLERWNVENPHPKGWLAKLADRPCTVGQVYEFKDGSLPDYVGFNNFEACFRWQYTDGKGKTKYRYLGGGLPGQVFYSPDEILRAFHSLVWVSVVSSSKMRVEQIVQRYQK